MSKHNKSLVNQSPATADTITPPSKSIEQSYVFNGERITGEVPATLTLESKLRFGVNRYNHGEQARGQAVYVFAEAASKLDAEGAKVFGDLLRKEFVNDTVARTLALIPPCDGDDDASKAQHADRVKIATVQAETEAKRRVDNLGQAVRAARWALANPTKVADGVSVFTLAQANAYLQLEAPKPAKEGEAVPADKLAEYATKEAIADAVVPLLAIPGTSQGAIKKAISEAKAAQDAKEEAAEKARVAALMEKMGNAPANTTSPEEAAKLQSERALVNKLVTAAVDWEACVKSSSPAAIRALLVNPTEPDGLKLAEVVRNLALLAGWSTTALAK